MHSARRIRVTLCLSCPTLGIMPPRAPAAPAPPRTICAGAHRSERRLRQAAVSSKHFMRSARSTLAAPGASRPTYRSACHARPSGGPAKPRSQSTCSAAQRLGVRAACVPGCRLRVRVSITQPERSLHACELHPRPAAGLFTLVLDLVLRGAALASARQAAS